MPESAPAYVQVGSFLFPVSSDFCIALLFISLLAVCVKEFHDQATRDQYFYYRGLPRNQVPDHVRGYWDERETPLCAWF